MTVILGTDPGVRNYAWALIRVHPRLELCGHGRIGLAMRSTPEQISAHFAREWPVIMRRATHLGTEALTWFSKSQERRGKKPMPNELMVKIAIAYAEKMHAARDIGVRFKSIHPADLKAAVTGRRKGSKAPMLERARELFPDWRTTGKEAHHEADAICSGLACWAPEILLPGRVSAQ